MLKRKVEFILIPSTLCNLRCKYCYEMDKLGDRARMRLEELEVVFRRLADFCNAASISEARIVWHGGEPLVLPPRYFWRAFEVQKRAFAHTGVEVENVTQTNLTILDGERLELLAHGFDLCGVSLDLFGGLRVNHGGSCQESKTLRNLEVLRAAGVPVGGITVLSAANVHRVREIYRFYLERELGFRLLPLHAGDYASGQWFEIEPVQTLSALCLLTDLWLATKNAPNVYPVVDVIRDVVRAHTERDGTPIYDRRSWEPMVAIDREGFVYTHEDIHNRSRSYGNLLTTPLQDLLASEAHERLACDTERCLDAICGSCRHYGRTCSGLPVAEGGLDVWNRDADGSTGCTVFAGLIEHVETRLANAGLISLETPIRQQRLSMRDGRLRARRSLPLMMSP